MSIPALPRALHHVPDARGLAPVTRPSSGGAPTATVRYWAAARAAAGCAEESLPLEELSAGPGATAVTVDDVLDAVRQRHGPELARVLRRCSYLLDSRRARGGDTVRAGDVLEVLPPFAGGC